MRSGLSYNKTRCQHWGSVPVDKSEGLGTNRIWNLLRALLAGLLFAAIAGRAQAPGTALFQYVNEDALTSAQKQFVVQGRSGGLTLSVSFINLDRKAFDADEVTFYAPGGPSIRLTKVRSKTHPLPAPEGWGAPIQSTEQFWKGTTGTSEFNVGATFTLFSRPEFVEGRIYINGSEDGKSAPRALSIRGFGSPYSTISELNPNVRIIQ
jgi:hypothetical protein